MEEEQKKHKINTEDDFIDCPKYKNSIKRVLDKNPNGIENSLIAKYLAISVGEVESIYNNTIKKLKDKLSF